MTKKRWIVLAGVLAACVCLTLAVLALLPPRRGVTLANIERIEKGMTLAEVEKILGGPGERFFSDPLSGHYEAATNTWWARNEYIGEDPSHPSPTIFVWGRLYEGPCVAVSFNRDNNYNAFRQRSATEQPGRVIEKNWRPGPTIFQRLFNSLRL
jgi:hypothetical protein